MPNISISQTQWKKLNSMKEPGETFADILNKFLGDKKTKDYFTKEELKNATVDKL